MNVGDKIKRPVTGLYNEQFRTKTAGSMTGTVVWIHPLGRFLVAEFHLGEMRLRECYEVPR